MNVLSSLDEQQQRSLIHLLRNSSTAKATDGQELREVVMDSLVDDSLLKEMAEVTEEESFNLKNRYRHQRRTMDYADKKRMKVDESSVRDMLRN